MAENLGLEIVAEGVEREEVHEALKQLGCRYFQGSHCGRPEPLDASVQRLRNSHASETRASAGAFG